MGWRVRVINADWNTLLRLRKPLLALMPEHALVVCAINTTKGVQVADPFGGLYWYTTNEFRQRYQNVAISVFRDNPFE